MLRQQLSHREHLLSLWVQDRLAERETVMWAVDALKKIHGSLGAESVSLFEFLDLHAAESEGLSNSFKSLWRLLSKVARESVFPENIASIYQLKSKIKAGQVRPEDLHEYVEYLRPRLKAKELSSWAISEETRSDNPFEWVRWDFETALHRSYQASLRLNPNELALLHVVQLIRILEHSAAALIDALDLARDVGWLGVDRDLPNLLVHRVFDLRPKGDAAANEDQDDIDADDSNNNLAPLTRLISEAFNALAEKDKAAAKKILKSWTAQNSGLFLRLRAVAMWHPQVATGSEVARFLVNLRDDAFWRSLTFPEIATLRAKRWKDIPLKAWPTLESRLLAGPPLGERRQEDAGAVDRENPYLRDYELARIVDAGSNIPVRFQKLVDARRLSDQEFPPLVPALESGLPGARVFWGPQGSPEKFSNIPTSALLEHLANSKKSFSLDGDDAEAFGATIEGKRRLIEALMIAPPQDEVAEVGWKLLLSYSHTKSDDPDNDRALIEEIARLALELPSSLFGRIAGQMSYWIDASDEKVPRFDGSDELWTALLPYAAAEANSGAFTSTDGEAALDLASAALNEPLGHLLSLFLRRCPSIQRGKELPPLPVGMIAELKKLEGRARELLTNRMAIHMNYFALADREWLDDLVIGPMLKEGLESDRIWEAFAKYSHVPSGDIWRRLQSSAYKRLSSVRLSPEAKRRLAEINVMIWIWSKEKESPFRVDTANMRTAFSLANDDVRAAAAWQFTTLFNAKNDIKDKEVRPRELWSRLGQSFFDEIWPLEPALQSVRSASNFARIPGSVGVSHFSEAVDIVLRYLQPFEVWDVQSAFNLDPKDSVSTEIATSSPDHLLVLLSTCISDRQQHFVFHLGVFLDKIVDASPELQRDFRMRFLRRLSQ
jgi:hypothetical protein